VTIVLLSVSFELGQEAGENSLLMSLSTSFVAMMIYATRIRQKFKTSGSYISIWSFIFTGFDPLSAENQWTKRPNRSLLNVPIATVARWRRSSIKLFGASLFDNNHAYSKTLLRFGELVKKYAGKEIEFDLRGNSELGIEPDYVNFLTQGVAIVYSIVAPSNLARFAPSVPLMDMPFVFRDLDHWNAVLSSDVLKPLEDILHQ
jgi:TRAP-type C4-dicarboxylate transport system substrate-binding protein